jgi:hypothetical protein
LFLSKLLFPYFSVTQGSRIDSNFGEKGGREESDNGHSERMLEAKVGGSWHITFVSNVNGTSNAPSRVNECGFNFAIPSFGNRTPSIGHFGPWSWPIRRSHASSTTDAGGRWRRRPFQLNKFKYVCHFFVNIFGPRHPKIRAIFPLNSIIFPH